MNPIRRENARPGTGAWRKPAAPPGTIEGYASEVSAVPGGAVHLHVSTSPAARYRIEVYRLGWYQGAGGRLIGCLPSCAGDEAGAGQPVPPPDPTTGEVRAAWTVTDVVAVPPQAVSGYYIADLVLTSGPAAGSAAWVPFIVREPRGRESAILVQAPVNTWQAYNPWGGKSLYDVNSVDGVAAVRASFDRPYAVDRPSYPAGRNNLFNWEYPLVRFLERAGYDLSYTSDVDTDAVPSELLRHRVVIVAGHDEYWTSGERRALEAARDAGVGLAFMGANDGYWQIRYEDGRRTIDAYRSFAVDPVKDPALATVRFRDLVPAQPECELLGVQHQPPGGRPRADNPNPGYQVEPSGLVSPWFAGTGLTASSSLPGLVGYEWDGLQADCSPPAPAVVLFRYPGPPSSAEAVAYTASSGAVVFSSGSLQFSWGLDDWGDHGVASPGLQRFVQNLLDDMVRRGQGGCAGDEKPRMTSPICASRLSPDLPESQSIGRCRPLRGRSYNRAQSTVSSASGHGSRASRESRVQVGADRLGAGPPASPAPDLARCAPNFPDGTHTS